MNKLILIGTFLFNTMAFGQNLEVVPLGVYGGSDESNLSAYLVGNAESNQYLSMDAGTIYSGIKSAVNQGTFNADISTVLKDYIKGYFISHGHLDHLSGMIINSPEDSKKPIYGTKEMVDVLKNNYFTNAAWANFGNEGELPIINKYTYQVHKNQEEFEIKDCNLKAQIFELSHVNPWKSSALLISNSTQSLIYFGDTGADRIEKSDRLNQVWKAIAPKIKVGNLKTLMIEVSFPSTQPETSLFGHLTPKLLFEELQVLAKYTGKEKLKGLNIIVTHIKPKGNTKEIIQQELDNLNDLGLNFIFPRQGERILIK